MAPFLPEVAEGGNHPVMQRYHFIASSAVREQVENRIPSISVSGMFDA